ncbi:MAG: hypothetical protein AB7S48_10345 [Bacteroidales bacterium]
MAERKVSERKLILLTVGFLIIAGIIRLISYRVGAVFFYLAFVPFVFHRVTFYIKNKSVLSNVDKYRKYTLILMLFTIGMNIIGWQDIEFFLLFILAIDYLIIVNRKKITKVNDK